MGVILTDQELTIDATLCNLLQAGVMTQPEVANYRARLLKLGANELLATLLNSWLLREESTCLNPTALPIQPISLN